MKENDLSIEGLKDFEKDFTKEEFEFFIHLKYTLKLFVRYLQGARYFSEIKRSEHDYERFVEDFTLEYFMTPRPIEEKEKNEI